MIDELLKNYRENKARVMCRKIDKEGYEKQLMYKGTIYIEPDKETIEGLAMPAVMISDMPRANTNKFHSATEAAAEHYQEETINENDFDVFEIKEKIKELEYEIEQLQRDVDIVDAAMVALDTKEQFAIRKRYIEGYYISEIVIMFAEKFKYGSETTIKNMISDSLEKMDRVVTKKKCLK